jgi:hypothetical protein
MEKLTITLSGPRRCGKTHIGILIEDALKEYGYDVEWMFSSTWARESVDRRRDGILKFNDKEKLKERGPGDGHSPYGHEYKRIALVEDISDPRFDRKTSEKLTKEVNDMLTPPPIKRSENAKSLMEKFENARTIRIGRTPSKLNDVEFAKAWDAGSLKYHDFSLESLQIARRELVESSGEKCSMLFLDTEDYDQLLSMPEFAPWFDAYDNHTAALEKGKVGVMAGMEVHTDANFPPDQRFLTSSWVGSKVWPSIKREWTLRGEMATARVGG